MSDDSNPPKILIVEDDVAVRTLIKKVLLAQSLTIACASPSEFAHNDIYFDSELIKEQKRLHKKLNSTALSDSNKWRGGSIKKGGNFSYRRK